MKYILLVCIFLFSLVISAQTTIFIEADIQPAIGNKPIFYPSLRLNFDLKHIRIGVSQSYDYTKLTVGPVFDWFILENSLRLNYRFQPPKLTLATVPTIRHVTAHFEFNVGTGLAVGIRNVTKKILPIGSIKIGYKFLYQKQE